jgi:hypothetical protein
MLLGCAWLWQGFKGRNQHQRRTQCICIASTHACSCWHCSCRNLTIRRRAWIDVQHCSVQPWCTMSGLCNLTHLHLNMFHAFVDPRQLLCFESSPTGCVIRDFRECWWVGSGCGAVVQCRMRQLVYNSTTIRPLEVSEVPASAM